MPAKTEKIKGFTFLTGLILTTTNEPEANIIDGNNQLYVLSHISDNLQDVTDVVFDRLPNYQESTPDLCPLSYFVTDIYKET